MGLVATAVIADLVLVLVHVLDGVHYLGLDRLFHALCLGPFQKHHDQALPDHAPDHPLEPDRDHDQNHLDQTRNFGLLDPVYSLYYFWCLYFHAVLMFLVEKPWLSERMIPPDSQCWHNMYRVLCLVVRLP